MADAWYQFLKEKFRATDTEQGRPEMDPLPVAQGDVLTEKEIQEGLSKMPKGKAQGMDNIPASVYRNSKVCNKLLVQLLQKIWATEEVPEDFAKAQFVMIYKNKGSHNDPSKYRCIGLLNHCYKILSHCMLARLAAETQGFLAD